MWAFLFFLVLVVVFWIDPMWGWVLVVALVTLAIVVHLLTKDEAQKQAERVKVAKEQAELARQMEEERFDKLLNSLSEKYGTPEKIINLNIWGKNDTDKYIMVFAKSSMLYACDREISFSDIDSYKMIDNYQIKHGKVTGSLDTKTNTKSLVGRSVGGALIGGGVGAVIGASSASKNTDINYAQDNDKVIHDYTLIICTKSFESPTIEIAIGDNWKKATEIEAIFNLIVENPTQTPISSTQN